MRAPVQLKEKFSAQNFNNISTDAYINHSAIGERGTNKNPAGTPHFNSLLDHHALVRPRNTILNHPCGATSGRGTGRGILAVVEKHARVETRGRVNSLTRDTEEKLSTRAIEIFRRTLLVDLELANPFKTDNWNHRERRSGGNSLNGKREIEVGQRNAGDFRDCAVIMRGAELRIALPHFAERRLSRLSFE